MFLLPTLAIGDSIQFENGCRVECLPIEREELFYEDYVEQVLEEGSQDVSAIDHDNLKQPTMECIETFENPPKKAQCLRINIWFSIQLCFFLPLLEKSVCISRVCQPVISGYFDCVIFTSVGTSFPVVGAWSELLVEVRLKTGAPSQLYGL
jgi:hypothetical protein